MGMIPPTMARPRPAPPQDSLPDQVKCEHCGAALNTWKCEYCGVRAKKARDDNFMSSGCYTIGVDMAKVGADYGGTFTFPSEKDKIDLFPFQRKLIEDIELAANHSNSNITHNPAAE